MAAKDPAAGDPAPDFTAAAHPGGSVTLSAFRGRPVVLYFYPKDSTPGCTREACDFRDRTADLGSRKAVVLGVSRDSLKSHQRFAEAQGLDFTLVSDPDEAVCRAYGVIREKKMYGKTVMGIERSTFLIDREGRIARVWRGVKVPGHVEEVLGSL